VRFPRATRLAVFAKSRRAAQRIMASVTRYVTDELRLVVNKKKGRVVTSQEFEFLIRLGVPRRQTIRHARSRNSYWHMAKTIASGVGLTNAWLAEQGLLSMKTLRAELAPLRRTA